MKSPSITNFNHCFHSLVGPEAEQLLALPLFQVSIEPLRASYREIFIPTLSTLVLYCHMHELAALDEESLEYPSIAPSVEYFLPAE